MAVSSYQEAVWQVESARCSVLRGDYEDREGIDVSAAFIQ